MTTQTPAETSTQPAKQPAKEYASKSQEKRVRTQRAGKSDGSNDVERT